MGSHLINGICMASHTSCNYFNATFNLHDLLLSMNFSQIISCIFSAQLNEKEYMFIVQCTLNNVTGIGP